MTLWIYSAQPQISIFSLNEVTFDNHTFATAPAGTLIIFTYNLFTEYKLHQSDDFKVGILRQPLTSPPDAYCNAVREESYRRPGTSYIGHMKRDPKLGIFLIVIMEREQRL
ncbi:hypothetical protein JAAARDRAFT_42812 [Jaapia argillacea MUCL 33604]|uniref:Uncharacterized protein n=1 Tax=Jaapia argillacea MUCL 33604 TaxID=933084 RepID=A0A067P433_9AGAM|nr:hypothetical protein JAAARDRAFT_42812 [Jaapia argillacea MUCL 33604]